MGLACMTESVCVCVSVCTCVPACACVCVKDSVGGYRLCLFIHKTTIYITTVVVIETY